MLTTHYDQCQKGNTVPYGRRFKGRSRNHGFVDLRGRPDLVAGIPEVAESAALKGLLISAAAPKSPVFTLGCDLGVHQEETNENVPRCVAGGYVQLMMASYDKTSGDMYFTLTHAITAVIDASSSGHSWELRFECTPVDFKLDTYIGILPSLWIWFFASAMTPAAARESRELLIGALHNALLLSG